MGRTAPLTCRRYILYIYSTNIRIEYFKHAAHSPFYFSSKCRLFHNSTFFGSCIIHILNTGGLKFKRKFRRQRVNENKMAEIEAAVWEKNLNERGYLQDRRVDVRIILKCINSIM